MSTLSPMTLTSYEISAGARASTEARAPMVPALAARSAVKRTMDLVGSVGGLIMLAPLLALIGLLVWIESRGPVLFRQPRTGLNGRVFLCLKFRSMVADAEDRLRELEARNESAGGVLFKIKHDPRVTPLGRFLRKTSLDELPQLWNVLVGEMSLVGPRPLQLRDSQKLADLDPRGFERRLSVTPGITGPWQVAGRSEIDSRGMLGLDLEYVAKWSMTVDLRILVKTVSVVLVGKGAC